MTFLATIALIAIPYLLILVLVSGIGVGMGFCLRWLFGIELGSAIISGTISASVAAYFVVRIFSSSMDPFGDEDEPTIVYLKEPLARRGKQKRRRE